MKKSCLPFLSLGLTPNFISKYLEHSESALAGVDIENEYKLIQQKKSKLSASQRRRVVTIWKENQC